MGIFSTINYNNNNKTFISTTTISFFLTITVGSLFFVSVMSNQTFAQENSLSGIGEKINELFNDDKDSTTEALANNTKMELNEQEKEKMNPISDEMLEYAEEQFPSLKDPTLSREDKVKILNQQFTDPELGLKSMRNLELGLETMQYKIEQVIEELYIECTVAKEKGEFDKTIDCMNWARDNAAIPIN
jgi:hypothetical protein